MYIFCRFHLTAVLVILILPITVSCQQFSGQKKTIAPPAATSLNKYLRSTFTGTPRDQQVMMKGMKLFEEKCSSCHEPNRALTVIKDPAVWVQTIKRMQYYSKGAISDQEAKELVEFHVTAQQREIDTFEKTCTKCHDDERINSRSMSEDQWLATIKRMQQKAPELITDEKVYLLAAYFHRRELAMARIFYGKCRLCHLESSGADSIMQINGLIVLANEEFGRSMRVTNARNLISSHTQRQKRNMQIYENNCIACHPGKMPAGKDIDNNEKQEERNRAEWISFIAELQGVELNKEIQNAINSQIEFHISKH
jgi:cytochrome c5